MPEASCFSVVAVELIPDLLREHAPTYTAVGFALGVATMLAVRALLDAKAAHEERGDARTEGGADTQPAKGEPQPPLAMPIPIAMLIATAVDLAVDGILLGIGFAAGAKEGRMLAFALATELVARNAAAREVEWSRARVRPLLRLCGSPVPRDRGAPRRGPREKETPWMTGMFFAGSLLFLVIGVIG